MSNFKEINPEKDVQKIVDIVRQNYPTADYTQIIKAYELAKKAHGDQKRRSGEPYIIHPIAVAKILAEYHLDVDTIVAALLHDVIEDTEYTYEDLEEIFNEHIAYMVESVSKITRLNYQSKEESQAEYIRKMVLSMSNDIRIIIIKLVDRLHNMRTLEYMSTPKQKEKSRETLEIYAPIANRLGIQSIKTELEDLAFRYLKPKEFSDLQRKVDRLVKDNTVYIETVVNYIKDQLKENGIEAKVYGRRKHLYSIYKKMKKDGRSFDEIYDLFAVRVITKNVGDCYLSLGLFHTTWNAIPNRMKDYINVPKPNGYQSLHTTVIGPKGFVVEIQIRDEEMHERNEFGVAAHWKYKEGIKGTTKKDQKFDEGIAWLRRLIDWTDELNDPSEFLETMKVDILDEEVYVYTPKGEIVELPVGSTPVDFAYRIHTDIGNKCIAAKVNDKMVQLTDELHLGDIVTIITSNNSNGPNPDWLKSVKTHHAKNKIKQYFKNAKRDENIHKGKLLLKNELTKLGFDAKELLKAENLSKISESYGYNSINEVYLNLGVSTIKFDSLLRRFKTLFPEIIQPEEKETAVKLSLPTIPSNTDILVEGIPGIETHLAKCCNPVPGDPIVGYSTLTNGISVHRMDCPNIAFSRNPEKLVDVSWNTIPQETTKYKSNIYVETLSKQGSLMEIIKPFYDLNIPITSTRTKTVSNNDIFNISCEVNSLNKLEDLLKEIKRNPDVLKVSRN